MIYLAQVQKKDFVGKAQLQLLAHQRAEHAWAILFEKDNVLVEAGEYQEGSLVLVELSGTRQVKHIQDATGWVLDVIKQYLSTGITPTTIQQEAQRAEQWRQSLTLQSQELGRRALEMEARRDQIQELEANLKQEKKQLELQSQELGRRALEMEAHRGQIQELEASLKQEKKQLELTAAELKANANNSVG